ncbi:hypothetical protein [Armatimonas sp.]|uniref:hypothetical protein n=1 Tax=Armatimonas sp. TaxID=1872638 RepID=UPI00286B9529|nr:hypothetical protein [Armatimonas sp.]
MSHHDFTIPSWLKSERRFEPGTISISIGAQEALRVTHTSAEALIARHCSGDFGELPESDRKVCEANILTGGYVTSVYSIPRFPLGLGREHLWIYSHLRERWSYICLPSEVGNLL